jgi:DNA repair ATPase RecN
MRALRLLTFTMLCAAGAATLSAQARQGGEPRRGGAPDPQSATSPAEVQRMFDAYAVMQAQEQLKISNEQFPQFLQRYKALQDLRRKNLQEHARLIAEMRRLLNTAQPDEAQLKDRLKALQDAESRAMADVRKAYDALDQALDTQQQAKFRVFEEVMERRKLELVTRARQANRANSKLSKPPKP